jgi:hypothetical protein
MPSNVYGCPILSGSARVFRNRRLALKASVLQSLATRSRREAARRGFALLISGSNLKASLKTAQQLCSVTRPNSPHLSRTLEPAPDHKNRSSASSNKPRLEAAGPLPRAKRQSQKSSQRVVV